MGSVIRRFAGPGVIFLFWVGLDIAGIEDFRIAIGLWAIAALWSIAAISTMPKVKAFPASLLRRIRSQPEINQIVGSGANALQVKIEEDEWELSQYDIIILWTRLRIKNLSEAQKAVSDIKIEPHWVKNAAGGEQIDIEREERAPLPTTIEAKDIVSGWIAFEFRQWHVGGGAARKVQAKGYRLIVKDELGKEYEVQRQEQKQKKRIWTNIDVSSI